MGVSSRVIMGRLLLTLLSFLFLVQVDLAAVGSKKPLPKKVLGMYILLADNTEDDFHDDADWEPLLYPYQQDGANVLFFTFIDPSTMEVPLAFRKLAATRGTDAEGAGPHPQAGANMIVFIRKIKELAPDWLVTQPTYGYPQIKAEIDVINASWNKGGTSNNLADSVGLMVYEGTQALQYVKNYAAGSSQWEGFPIKVDVPKPQILLGAKGTASPSSIQKLASESVSQDLLGIMVWFCSVQNGLVYGHGWDCTESTQSQQGYVDAKKFFDNHQ